jgi:transcription antitermination factor NusA-like protein
MKLKIFSCYPNELALLEEVYTEFFKGKNVALLRTEQNIVKGLFRLMVFYKEQE